MVLTVPYQRSFGLRIVSQPPRAGRQCKLAVKHVKDQNYTVYLQDARVWYFISRVSFLG